MNYGDFQFLKFDPKPNGVLLMTINRPEVMNATNGRLHWELTKIWDVVNHDPEVRVIVVTGAGDRAFSAGGICHGSQKPSAIPTRSEARSSAFKM